MGSVGTVEAIALKVAHGAPMKVVDSAEIVEGQGMAGSVESHRHVTFLSQEHWESVQGELEGDKPWHTRRANVLVKGLDMKGLVNKTLAIGSVRVAIKGETRPCHQMEASQEGLEKALAPQCRGGVHGQVEAGGPIRVGDTIEVI